MPQKLKHTVNILRRTYYNILTRSKTVPWSAIQMRDRSIKSTGRPRYSERISGRAVTEDLHLCADMNGRLPNTTVMRLGLARKKYDLFSNRQHVIISCTQRPNGLRYK
jgi:hypothetical protein